jgi:xylulokinase
MAGLLLGIDVGTYSSKGVLVTPEGEVLLSRVVPHTMDVPRPGWAEQDADAVWWRDTVELSRALLDGSPYSGADVAGVAVSAIGPCLLPLDEEGRPLRKGILYGVDARAEEEIGLLNERLGEDNVYRFSNMTFTSQAIGPKILWLQRHEPEVWRRTRRLTTASSYLVYRLTGEHVIDRHTAGHYMPLLDPSTGEWSDRYAELVAPLEMLPRLAWSDAQAGEVSAAGAAETGLEPGTPVAVGAVDALSEAISVGAVEPGDLMVMYGSTAFFILVGEKPVPDRRTWSVPGAFEGQYNLAAGMATTGSLTRWFRDELARELPEEQAYGALFESAARVPPGAEGLLMLPYFSGERTPINDARARGVIAGLSLSHRREHLFRAVLESVAYGIRHNLETFQEMGAPIRRIVAVGGGAQSDTWLRIVSDVAGVAQVLPKQTIGASYGDAFLAGRAAGMLEPGDLGGWVQVRETIEPDASRQALYEPLYRDFLELYRQTREIVHRLGRRAQGD